MRQAVFVIFTISLVLLAGCDKPENKKPAETGPEKKQPVKTEIKTEQPSIVKIKLVTTKGDIVIELNQQKAPVTCANILNYINEGFYEGIIFHRVIPNFMIQTGGHKPGLIKKNTNPPIVNEAANGLKNLRGTVSMARTPIPNSATSQFFINLVDNDSLNFVQDSNPGYAVFGKVVQGMNVVDEIAKVSTTTIKKSPREIYQNVPVQDVVIKSTAIIKQ